MTEWLQAEELVCPAELPLRVDDTPLVLEDQHLGAIEDLEQAGELRRVEAPAQGLARDRRRQARALPAAKLTLEDARLVRDPGPAARPRVAQQNQDPRVRRGARQQGGCPEVVHVARGPFTRDQARGPGKHPVVRDDVCIGHPTSGVAVEEVQLLPRGPLHRGVVRDRPIPPLRAGPLRADPDEIRRAGHPAVRDRRRHPEPPAQTPGDPSQLAPCS